MESNIMTQREQLHQAITLVKSGDKQNGGRILAEILKADPQNELAWLWMSGVVATGEQREHCLNQVLRVNPHNQLAREGLVKLQQMRKSGIAPVELLREKPPPANRVEHSIRSSPAPPQEEMLVAPDMDERVQKGRDSGVTELQKGVERHQQHKASPHHEQLVSLAEFEDHLAKLKSEEDFFLGLMGGIVGMVLGAALWTMVALITGHHIGWIALGLGLLTGGGVRILGRGFSAGFGIMGGFLALIGCFLGYVITIAVVVKTLDITIIMTLIRVTFGPKDVVFYLLATYAGYRTAFRRINARQLTKAPSSESSPSQRSQIHG
jgi:hypothetical protein